LHCQWSARPALTVWCIIEKWSICTIRSDTYLTPSKQFFNSILARTSYISLTIKAVHILAVKYIETCIKRSDFGTKQMWHYKTGDFLKEVQFIWNFLWQFNKMWPFKTGDCLKVVTTWVGLIAYAIAVRFVY
jgi:hypothetical protein